VLLNSILSALWVGFSLSLVVEPRAVQEFVLYGQGVGGVFRKLVPGIVTSVMVGLVSLAPLQAEVGVVKSARRGWEKKRVGYVRVGTHKRHDVYAKTHT
jgi:hypothetical protein